MKGSYNNILNHSPCPDEKMLEKYTKGKLSGKDKYEIEKHLLDCEMCSDLVEGLQLAKQSNTDITSIVANINTEIDNLSEEESKTKKIIPLWLRYAAVIALLIGIGFLVREFMFYGKFNAELAINKHEPAKEIEKSRNIRVNEAEEETIDDVASELPNEVNLAESLKKPQHEALSESPEKTSEELGKVDRLDDINANGFTMQQGEGGKSIQEKKIPLGVKQETKEIAEEEPREPTTIVESETINASGEAMAKKTRKKVRLKDTETEQDFEEQEEAEAINDNKNNWRLFGKKDKKVAAGVVKETAPAAGYYIDDDKNIQELYQNQRYQQIIDIYAKQENLGRNQNYYLGLSYYYTQTFDKAISFFDRSIQDNNDDTTLNSLFYKALSLSKTNNKDKATYILQELQEIDHPISIKAKKILIKLQND